MAREKKSKIIILGAGLAGLAVAFKLEQGYKFLNYNVYEKEDCPGGLARTEKYQGFFIDCTGHFLHLKDQEVKNTVFRLIGKELKEHFRQTFIFTHSRYLPYPFETNLYYLPEKIKQECLNGFSQTHKKQDIKGSFESFYHWVSYHYGNGIGRHFMFPYNQKLWLTRPQDLTIDWLKNFFPKVNHQEIIKGASTPSKKRFGYNAVFLYPRNGGIKILPEALAGQIKPIYFNKETVAIDIDKRVVNFTDGTQDYYDKLVTTLPLPNLIKITKGLPDNIRKISTRLKWTSVLNINLGIKDKVLAGKHWVYFPSAKIPFYRLGVSSNIEPSLAPRGCSLIYIEISCQPNQIIDRKAMVKKTIDSLIELKIIKKKSDIIMTRILEIPFGYVIYDKFYQSARRQILKFLEKNGVYSIGRFGGWEYSSMEDVISSGFQTINNLLK